MEPELPKVGRLAVAKAFAELAVAASTPDVQAHVLIARARKVVDWLEAGAPAKGPRLTTKVAATADVLSVFEHWRLTMRKNAATKLTPERAKKIADRLGEGATVELCKRAIDGCRASPHHNGKKSDSGTVYDSIDLIFRTTDKMEWFAAQAPSRAASLRASLRESAPANPTPPREVASPEEAQANVAKLQSILSAGKLGRDMP